MQIGVIGATGTIGSRVVSEALSRGHHVAAFSSDASQIQDSRDNITWKASMSRMLRASPRCCPAWTS